MADDLNEPSLSVSMNVRNGVRTVTVYLDGQIFVSRSVPEPREVARQV